MDAEDNGMFIAITFTLYLIVSSEKYKSEILKKHILKDIISRGIGARITKI